MGALHQWENPVNCTLRLVCGDVLGGRIDREDALERWGMVAAVARERGGLVIRLAPSPAGAGLEALDGLWAEDCAQLRGKLRSLGAVVAPGH